MTLTDITNIVLDKFRESDSVSIDSFSELKLDNNLILTALYKLEETDLIAKISGSTPETFILTRPLKAQGQSIDVSMETCCEIADVINSFLDATQDDNPTEVRADKLNISEAEIVMLINIINETVVKDPEFDDGEDDDFKIK